MPIARLSLISLLSVLIVCSRVDVHQLRLQNISIFFFYRCIITHTFKNIKTLSPGTNILGVPGKKQKEIPN